MRVNPLQRYPSDLARCKNDIAQLSGRLFVFHDAFKPWYLTSSYCQRRRGQSLPYSFIKTTWDVRCNYTNGWPRETSSTMCTGITKDSLVRIPTSFFCSLFCFIIFRFIGLVFDLFYCHGIAIQQLKTPLNWTNLSDRSLFYFVCGLSSRWIQFGFIINSAVYPAAASSRTISSSHWYFSIYGA